MYTIQDVRDAHQMWEYMFQNTGREGIVLNCAKSRSLIGLLLRIFHKTVEKASTGDGSVSMKVSKSGATP
jgi:hypothetical protein